MNFSMFATCQQVNILTHEEYQNIKINGVELELIKNTFGNEQEIIKLFGNTSSKNIDPDGDFYQYYFNDFKISFSSIISDGTYDRPIMSHFEINTNKGFITVKGISFTIGDKISVLGENIVFNTKRDGSKGVVYSPMKGWNNFIAIDFNQETKIITAIYYIELT